MRRANYTIAIVGVFAVAVFLRLLLCWENPPSNSFDDHFEPINLIMKTGQIPPKDACFQCYQPPVFYYISAKIGTFLSGIDQQEKVIRKSLQFVNCLYNILGLAFILLILQKLHLSRFSRLFSFSIICFLPSHIFMSAMHSNDNLAYLIVAICTYLFLVAIDRKLVWLPVAFLSIAISIALFVKYTSFVVLPMVAIPLALLPFSRPSLPRSRIITVLVLVLLPAMLLMGSYMIKNLHDYNNPLPWNNKTFDTSLRHPRDPEAINFISFTPWQYIAEPLILPGQMHSFWTLIYSGSWFDTEPKFIHITDRDTVWWPKYFRWLAGVAEAPSLPSPLSGFTRIIGRGLLIGGLVPLALAVAGFASVYRRAFSERRSGLQIETLKMTMFPILLTCNIAGIILLTYKAPVYSSVKAAYFLNSLPAFSVFISLTVSALEDRKWMKILMAFVMLVLAVLSTVLILHIAQNFHPIHGKY